MPIFRHNERTIARTPIFERMAIRLRKLVPGRMRTASVAIAVSPGELLDKLTILEIKAQRISDPKKLRNVRAELDRLSNARHRSIRDQAELASLTAELRAVNETLWNIEDAIRGCEREGSFGPEFVELARSVYKTNDHREAIKRKINELLGSAILEEKSYQQ